MSSVIRIVDARNHEGKEVTIQGWLHNRRSSGRIHFLILRDGTGFIQTVMLREAIGDVVFASADHLSQETSLSVTGIVRADKRAKSGYEIDSQSFTVHGDSVDYPITPKEHGADFLMDRRHLWIRSERQTAILRIRHEVINAVRDFFNSRGFILCDTPILTPRSDEPVLTPAAYESSAFHLPYFEGQVALLTRSGQFYNEANAMALGKVYSFGPVFHAERMKTRRHLTEFWLAEPEVAYATLNDAIDLAGELICAVISRVLTERVNELGVLEREIERLNAVTTAFPRLTYDLAADVLTGAGQPLEYGADFGGTEETVLSEQSSSLCCIHRHPANLRPFNIKPDPEQPNKALSFDMLAPEGYGTILSGGQRIEDIGLLEQRMKERNISVEPLTWYLDLCRYGTVPRSGFSLNIERLIAWVCKLEHVREAIPYPRMLYRLYP